MKIISWNVNGIRAVLKKGLLDFLVKEAPDVLCLQEIKISDEAIRLIKLSFLGYEVYWNPAKRPGYSGTAVLVKSDIKNLIGVTNGIGKEIFDNEGRMQVLEFKNYYLLNGYFPNANSELSRLDYKLEFNKQLLKIVKLLGKKKSVIITGDYNVAHQEIDLARPKENINSPGFTPQERASMNKLIDSGFVDTFRHINGDKIKYSWWSYRATARKRNVGWRIDYFCVSDKLKKQVKNADILDEVMGSDHAPVLLEID